MRVPELTNANPVFKAYCKVKGLYVGDKYLSYEFTRWAVGKASEFQELRGIRNGEFAVHIEDYVTWISGNLDK